MTLINDHIDVRTGWVEVCDLDRLTLDRGAASIVGGHQVAIFRLSSGDLHAVPTTSTRAPAPPSSAGASSATPVGGPTVASPLYKQRFDLSTGDLPRRRCAAAHGARHRRRRRCRVRAPPNRTNEPLDTMAPPSTAHRSSPAPGRHDGPSRASVPTAAWAAAWSWTSLDETTGASGPRRGRQGAPGELRAALHEGATSADMLARRGGPTRAPAGERGGEPVGMPPRGVTRAARGLRAFARRARAGRARAYVSGRDVDRGSVPRQQARQGLLGTNQIESNSRLCMASAGTGYKQPRRRRPARLLRRPRPRRPVPRHRLEHGRLPPDLFCACATGQGRRQADRGRPAPHHHRRQGRPVPAGQPGTDLALLNGLLHLFVEGGRVDADFVAATRSAWPTSAAVRGRPGPTLGRVTGMTEADLTRPPTGRRRRRLVPAAIGWG